jgi:UTP--glucose-1-phosphate uridylyltransferase
MDIVKAIIPAAGLGTRCLPWTKAMPKEMLPLLLGNGNFKPALQVIVEEAIQSQINTISFIVNKEKSVLSNHFEPFAGNTSSFNHKELQTLIEIDRITRNTEFIYIRQPEPLGLGHAVWLARHIIGKEYFGIILPDDIIVNAQQPALSQLIRIARQERASVIGVQEVPLSCVSSYGIIDIRKQITPNLFQIGGIVEKPTQKDTPSQYGVVGRYFLSHKIFASLTELSSYSNGELHLTDAIAHMMRNQNEKVFAYKLQGMRYDLGTPIGWLKAVVGTALHDSEYGPELQRFLENINSSQPFLFEQAKTIEHQIA